MPRNFAFVRDAAAHRIERDAARLSPNVQKGASYRPKRRGFILDTVVGAPNATLAPTFEGARRTVLDDAPQAYLNSMIRAPHEELGHSAVYRTRRRTNQAFNWTLSNSINLDFYDWRISTLPFVHQTQHNQNYPQKGANDKRIL